MKKTVFLLIILLLPVFVTAGQIYALSTREREIEFKEIPPDSQLKTIDETVFNSPESLEGWKEHVFNGKTVYSINADETGVMALRGKSKGTASGLFKEMDIDIKESPYLRWDWRVTEFPSQKQNKKFAAKQDNDFGARVCVIFRGSNFFTTDIIQYVWDDYFPEGTFTSSPFFNMVKTIVVRKTENGKPGQWVTEKRDLARDYEMLFGKTPRKRISALAIMSDSDNTNTHSEAYLGRISVLKTA